MSHLTYEEQKKLLFDVKVNLEKRKFFGMPYFFKKKRIASYTLFFFLIYLVFIIKFATISSLSDNIVFGFYSLMVSVYILSRFALAYFHEEPIIRDNDFEPTISFGVPSKNEGENIYETVMRIARIDYPKNKFDIILVNDGSTDNTLEEMMHAKADAAKECVDVKVIDFGVNKGKREGMAECIERSGKDIILFIDSDSFVEPDAPRHLVKYFKDEKIGAVAGHA